ncbi:hypothetical protein CHS0354_023058 [Potamilus streckersoni]|uniref:Uncharacterized protein n=1 Tax=Potamilus streckersoni TaxID=2493646 RepID=A0AAE0VK25_9BIVA|nr:hypothetical protein CHS0354_023058 [Potamilus streckersoni]
MMVTSKLKCQGQDHLQRSRRVHGVHPPQPTLGGKPQCLQRRQTGTVHPPRTADGYTMCIRIRRRLEENQCLYNVGRRLHGVYPPPPMFRGKPLCLQRRQTGVRCSPAVYVGRNTRICNVGRQVHGVQPPPTLGGEALCLQRRQTATRCVHWDGNADIGMETNVFTT